MANKSKKDEHIINFNFEKIKQEGKINKNRKDVKPVYIKKNISKEKNKIIISNISRENNSKINNEKRLIHNPVIQEKNTIKNLNYYNETKNNEEKKEVIQNEKSSKDLSQMSTKNFNETLFDYKQYSLINNNPIKKKYEFEKELKKTKKLKDMSMKKKKQLWIKIDLMEKEKNNNDFNNDKKIYLSKPTQKSKIIELDPINEEENNKKENQEMDFGTDSRERNDEDETDLSSNLIKYN